MKTFAVATSIHHQILLKRGSKVLTKMVEKKPQMLFGSSQTDKELQVAFSEKGTKITLQTNIQKFEIL